MALTQNIEGTLFTEASNTAFNENCSTCNQEFHSDSLVDEDGKNMTQIRCRRCQCVILETKMVELMKKDEKVTELREMSVGGSLGSFCEKVALWWYTGDEYAFESIGFQTVDNLRSLMCGDCEFGPFGWRTDDNQNFYIAAERVEYHK